MEKLVLCHQQHSSTVYDAKATSLHWNALVGHSNEQSQSSSHDELDFRNKEQLKTRLPILKALAMEILNANKAGKPDEEAPQTNGADEVPVHHSCKKAAKKNRKKQKQKVAHSNRSEKKFVRECCTCGLPVRASTPKKSSTPKRSSTPRRGVGTTVDNSTMSHKSDKTTHQQPASCKNPRIAPVPQHLVPSHPVGMDRRQGHTKEFQGSCKHIPAVHGNRPRIVVHMPKTPKRAHGSLAGTHTGVTKKGTTAIPKVPDSEDISTRLEVRTIMNELEGDVNLSQSWSMSSHVSMPLPVHSFDTPSTDMTSPVPAEPSLVRAGLVSPPTNPLQVLTTENSTQTGNSPLASADISRMLEHNSTAEPSGCGHLSPKPTQLRAETTIDHEDMGSYNTNSEDIDCDSYSDDFMSASLSSISC